MNHELLKICKKYLFPVYLKGSSVRQVNMQPMGDT